MQGQILAWREPHLPGTRCWPRSSNTRATGACFPLLPLLMTPGSCHPIRLWGQDCGPQGALPTLSWSPGSANPCCSVPVWMETANCRQLSAGWRDCSNLFQGFELISAVCVFLIIGDTLQQESKQTNKTNPSASRMDVLATGQLWKLVHLVLLAFFSAAP